MSNWDFGRQPADHLDGSYFRDNGELAYPMGGVQWTGNKDWTGAGFDGFGGSDGFGGPGVFGGQAGPGEQGDLDDLDSAPYPITY